jgi:hypothetical protein
MNWETFKKHLGRHHTAEEYAIAIACAKFFEKPYQVWDIPCEVHGNIYGQRQQFGKAAIPWVIHYHKKSWAEKHRIAFSPSDKRTVEEAFLRV